jgi:uncharacterized membrane protein YoaK (UPF0700 family)
MATTGNHTADAASRSRAGAASTARHVSPAAVRDLLLVGLTVSSGAIDAISFIALGKVFTAFMTGNFVFLGLGVAGAGGPDVVRVLVAIGAFGAGVYVATRIIEGSIESGVWPRRVTAALGVTLLLQAVFLVVWVATSGRPGTGFGDLLTGLMALAMGMQSGAVMSLAVRGVFTTAATATAMFLMRDVAAWSASATERARIDAPRLGSAAAERARLAGVLAGLFAGATAGGLLLVHARTYAPVLPLVATALVIATASIALHGPKDTDTPGIE